jgi:hypothetical protein
MPRSDSDKAYRKMGRLLTRIPAPSWLKSGAGSERKYGSMAVSRPLLALALLPLLLAGCRKDEVTSYRVPAEKDPELPMAAAAPAGMPGAMPPAGGSMAETAVPTAEGPGLAWTAPAAWKAKPLSAMRKGSYSVSGSAGADADLSITAFPCDVGGDLANVNRWRGQVQLPPLTDASLPGAVARLEQNGLKMTVVDFASGSATPQRILGAIVPFNGGTWFFKLMGPDAVVAGAKPAFLAFLQTVHPVQP